MNFKEYNTLSDLLKRLEEFKPPMAEHKHVAHTIHFWRAKKLGEYLDTKQVQRLIALLKHILIKWKEETDG